MSDALLNIVVGLATSILSGGSVWIWQRGKHARILRRKAALFGLAPGEPCLIAATSSYRMPGTSSYHDIQAFIELATVATQLGCPVTVESSEGIGGIRPDHTEFCIGGPLSNQRTAAHLALHLPGAQVRPLAQGTQNSLAIVVGDQQFLWDSGTREYALVAKFTPEQSRRPTIVICGQTSITNRAAVHVLSRDFRQIIKTVASTDRFCIVIRIDASSTHGHQAASLERDVTDLAFAVH